MSSDPADIHLASVAALAGAVDVRMWKLTNGAVGVIGGQRQRGHAGFHVSLRLVGLHGSLLIGQCNVVLRLGLLFHFL